MMSTLKDKFDNYAPQPDPKVWEGINSSLLHIRMRRRMTVITSAVAVGVGATVLFFALNKPNPTSTVAETTNVVVAENNVETLPQQPVTAVEHEQKTVVSNEQKMPPAVYSCDFGGAQNAAQTTSSDAALNDEAKTSRLESATMSLPKQETASAPALPELQPFVTPAPQTAQADTKPADSKPAAQEPQRKISQKTVPTELAVWIPNAFSPDDPVEESARTFRVFPNDDATILSFEIYIYSRSGRLVYHSRDYKQGWDGTSKGQKQPMGTYVYIIELNDAVKGIQHTRGSITLIR